MGLLDSLSDLLNKFVPSRKASLVDQLNTLTYKYGRALQDGKDSEAAELLKQLKQLRKKAGFTEGDV